MTGTSWPLTTDNLESLLLVTTLFWHLRAAILEAVTIPPSSFFWSTPLSAGHSWSLHRGTRRSLQQLSPTASRTRPSDVLTTTRPRPPLINKTSWPNMAAMEASLRATQPTRPSQHKISSSTHPRTARQATFPATPHPPKRPTATGHPQGR